MFDSTVVRRHRFYRLLPDAFGLAIWGEMYEYDSSYIHECYYIPFCIYI